MTSDPFATLLFATLGRVRRAMPRNGDVMTICDALEERLVSPAQPSGAESEHALAAAGKLTRAEIQRAYRLRKKEQKP